MNQSKKLASVIKHRSSDITLLNIFVTPNSISSKIKGIDIWRNSLSISVKEEAHSGKANASVCILLETKLNFKNCQIIRGLKSRSKTVQINNSYDYIHKKLLEVSD